MSLRVRFQSTTGRTLKYTVERLADGLRLDHADNTFKASGWTTALANLTEGTGNFLGLYSVTKTPTPEAQYPNGDYVVTVHDGAAANLVISALAVQMYGGDDTTIFPSGAGTAPPTAATVAVAVWDALKASHLTPGTFGANLDATISSRLAAAAYSSGGTLSGLGFVVQTGSTATSVKLTVPSNTVGTTWRGRKLYHRGTGDAATITGVTKVGTTATVTIAAGWPTPAAGDIAAVSA